MENKGTPRPWTVREFPPATVWEGGNAPYTIEASGRLIAIGCAQKGETFDNANLICRSVNAHDAMREALFDAIASGCMESSPIGKAIQARMQAALSLAEGKEGGA